MPPQLVIANAPYKRYPGGVIALRATDWVAAARGTLSTEVDAFASNGEVVRDSQQVDDIYADEFAAYDAALDTLSIPLASIPVEDGLFYRIFATYRIEGDWDLDDEPLLQKCNNLAFRWVTAIGAHGTATQPESNAALQTRALVRIPYYAMNYLGTLEDVNSSQTIGIRAFSETGSTAEWLIDQLVFLPDTNYADWDGDDFAEIQGYAGFLLDNTPIDGADGGDDNGKFTLTVGGAKDDTMMTFPASGGDFQRKASAAASEYLVRVVAADGYKVVNTAAAPDKESATDAYSIHCVRNRGEIVWVDDTFDNRTTSPSDWGLSPEGYGYALGLTAAALTPHAFVSGGVGILRLRQGLTTALASLGRTSGPASTDNHGASLTIDDQWIFSGVLENTAGVLALGNLSIFAFSTNTSFLYTLEIRLDVVTKTWVLRRIDGITDVALGSTHDVSSWFGLGAPLGWRIEVKRYWLRLRVWDASGAEPGTWDEEMFVPLKIGGVATNYPYGDDESAAQRAYTSYTPFGVQISSRTSVGNVFPYDISVSQMKFEHDPYGDPADMSVAVERPEGTQIGELVIPYGCAYFVYWGRRDWTDLDGATPAYASISAKVWNDPAAAEMQWADAVFWWFRSIHEFLIPMNWRSSTREGGWKRVLKGDT